MRPDNPVRLAASALLIVATACAGMLDPGPGPGALRAQAEQAIDANELEAAYDHLVELQRRYPESRESATAFPLAAAIFQSFYWQNRFANPESRWLTTEPEFLFAWLATLPGDEFPEDAVTSLFVGLNYNFFRRFERFTASDARLTRWTLVAIEDNGIVESVLPGPAERTEANP
jgi:hypothetical protein